MYFDTPTTSITVLISSDISVSTIDSGSETSESSTESNNQTAKGRKKKIAKRRSGPKRGLPLWRWYQRLGHFNTADVK